MKKRGQVYILGAIIIGVSLFLIFSTINTVEQVDLNKNFEILNENFNREAERFINAYAKDTSSAKKDLSETFPVFTRDFNNFVKESNPNFGIITVLTYTEKTGEKITLVVNMLDTFVLSTTNFKEEGDTIIPSVEREDKINLIPGCSNTGGKIEAGKINIDAGQQVGVLSDCQERIENKRGVLLLINDIWHFYKVPEKEEPQADLIVTTKSEEREQTQVFTSEKQKKGVDDSKKNKATCTTICDENAATEDTCTPGTSKKKKECCVFIDKKPNNECTNQDNECCRVNCKRFKNRDSCELQNNDEGIRCCFTRNKCLNSVYNGQVYTCEGI